MTDSQTDGQLTGSDHNSSSGAFGSGKLNKRAMIALYP